VRQIPIGAVTQWSENKLPAALSVSCGICGSKEFFRPGDWKAHGNARYAHAPCPNCHAGSSFIVIGYVDSSKPLGGGEIFCHPSRPEWEPSPDLVSTLHAENTEIQRDYEQAIRYLNNGDAAAVVLAARRTLEGLAAQFLPPAMLTRRLAQDLAAMNKHRDLSPVLMELSAALKDAGNMGAHYGASRVTKEIAEQALSLAEELLKMHFLLKIRVDRLRDFVSNAATSGSTSTRP
jgi:hypothetical protein